ncbi:hypothetical protein [Paraglaciecola aestuariivivens]
MFKPFSHILLVVVMLVAFVGQALAYSAMSCEMSVHANSESHAAKQMDHSTMDHAGMDHSNMMQNSSAEECCELDCVCPAQACSSVVVFTSNSGITSILPTSSLTISYLTFPLTAISSSLFRPPIFA